VNESCSRALYMHANGSADGSRNESHTLLHDEKHTTSSYALWSVCGRPQGVRFLFQSVDVNEARHEKGR
jgi:hypothetical protein